jgi:hypothetical protein
MIAHIVSPWSPARAGPPRRGAAAPAQGAPRRGLNLLEWSGKVVPQGM